MKPDFDLVIIGAGVIGLAIASEASSNGLAVLIVEKADSFGTETSSRNSEVIHAGIYYPPGSLKAQLCIRGKRKLYDFCKRYDVPHRQTGKLIIASSNSDVETLKQIQAGATTCGVTDLSLLSKKEVSRIEPEISCVAGLFSPSTGIIDSHRFMQTLIGIASNFQTDVAYNTEVTAIGRIGSDWSVYVNGDCSPAVSAKFIVNAAGLAATEVAIKTEGMDPTNVPNVNYAKGNYFGYSGKVPFNHLIYPVPSVGGLGVHLTLDLAHQARFGPDVEWIDEINYAVNSKNLEYFVGQVSKFWPKAVPERFYSDYAGIRPKLSGPEGSFCDFVISDEDDHKLTNLINLYGIESPGITASLAIAELVVGQVREAV